MKYWLDFNGMDQNEFTLLTVEDHEEIYTGRLSEIEGVDEDWQNALDRFFEDKLGILPTEWEVG